MIEPILKVKTSTSVVVKIFLTLLSHILMAGSFAGGDSSQFPFIFKVGTYLFLWPIGLSIIAVEKVFFLTPQYAGAFIPVVLILSPFLTYGYFTALHRVFKKIKTNAFNSSTNNE